MLKHNQNTPLPTSIKEMCLDLFGIYLPFLSNKNRKQRTSKTNSWAHMMSHLQLVTEIINYVPDAQFFLRS